jgi:hypothetical protein
MAMFGTSFRRSCGRLARGVALALALAFSACSGDDDDLPGSMAGTTAGESGTSGGVGASGSGGAGSGGAASGQCNEQGCLVSKEAFQSEALNCPSDYDAATEEFQEQSGQECKHAFFECGGLKGAAYQYGFTGDNVQCYYDDAGELVGGVRTSDHGSSTVFGERPSPGCYTGPSCGDAGAIDPDAGLAEQRACQVHGDCVIMPLICCPCGELEPRDVSSINTDNAPSFFDRQCGENVACPAIECPTLPPRYIATCVAGTCIAVDLEDHRSTECTQPSDCRVRAAECCECGAITSVGQLVATSDGQAFSELVCEPQTGCPECEGVYPDEATVTCNSEQRCELMDSRQQL